MALYVRRACKAWPLFITQPERPNVGDVFNGFVQSRVSSLSALVKDALTFSWGELYGPSLWRKKVLEFLIQNVKYLLNVKISWKKLNLF